MTARRAAHPREKRSWTFRTWKPMMTRVRPAPISRLNPALVTSSREANKERWRLFEKVR